MSTAEQLAYEMGYGADEFGKVLKGPFSGEKSPYVCREVSRHHWALQQPGTGFELIIRVSELPPRKLGLFRLPVLDVRFDFADSAASLRDEFMHRFHQYFHKGGG